MFLNIRWAFLSLLITSAVFAEGRLDLTAGRLFLMGAMGLDYRWDDFTKNEHRLNIISDVGGGYLLKDNLAVGFSLPIEWQVFGKQAFLGIKPFATYFFDVGTNFYPYLGANLAPGYSTFGNGEFRLKAGIDSGVLVSLTESVALDFAIRPEIGFKLSPSQNWNLRVPMGFIGVRALF